MEKKQRETIKKVLSISLNTLFYLVIILLLLFSIANIKVKKENNIANIFGTGFLSVQSNSMFGDKEDSFEEGDLIFVKMFDQDNVSDLKVGDVVTYFDLTIKQFNTHRIVEINFDENYVVTQADYNYIGQNTNTAPDTPVNFGQILAVYDSKIPNLGNTLDRLQTPTGFALFVILPVILILAFEGFKLGKNIIQLNHSKMEEKFAQEKQDQESILALEKDKIRQEILAELNNEKNKDKQSK